MKPVILHPEARAELDEAMRFYEERREGLGLDLLDTVEQATARIQRNPDAHAVYEDTPFRKCVLTRFPYCVFYIERDEDIYVIAVAHSSRRPGYWRDRVDEG